MVTALVLLYFGFNFLKGIDFFSSNKRYFAVYDNVDKLTVSNQIYLSGFSVGRVSDITILKSNGNKVLVELEINSNIELTDSTIALLTGDFLGNKYITLSVLPGSRTLQPKDTVKSMLDKGIADILTESAVPVADNLQATLRNFNTLVDNLNKNSLELDTVLVRFKATPYALNRTINNANVKMDEVVKGVNTAIDNLNRVLTDMRPMMANLKTVSDSLKMIELGKTMRKVQETLTSLNATLEQLEKGDNTASKLLTEDDLYNNLNQLLLSLDTLATHFNTNPKHFLGPLGMNRKRIERDLKKQEKEQARKSDE